jgi:hypothetical protein
LVPQFSLSELDALSNMERVSLIRELRHLLKKLGSK